jgi:hypothetical protein
VTAPSGAVLNVDRRRRDPPLRARSSPHSGSGALREAYGSRYKRQPAPGSYDLDAVRSPTAAESLRDEYAATRPPGYDLVLEFSPSRFCLIAKDPGGFREQECVDLSPELAHGLSVYGRLAATAKFHHRVQGGRSHSNSSKAGR